MAQPHETTIRVVIADDERPARSFLGAMLRSFEGVELVGESDGGREVVELIERTRPDLALLDLQMPEVDGLAVVRLLSRESMPLVAFVTAYDEYAVRAFDLNAIDYLLKPVEPARLRQTINRAHERLERADLRLSEGRKLRVAVAAYDTSAGAPGGYLKRIPVRRKDDIIILPVADIASVIADGELLRITTSANQGHTITYRLKDLEARLDPAHFVRLSRGALANLDQIHRVSPMPGGTYVVTLANRQQLAVSRLRARALRDYLLKL